MISGLFNFGFQPEFCLTVFTVNMYMRSCFFSGKEKKIDSHFPRNIVGLIFKSLMLVKFDESFFICSVGNRGQTCAICDALSITHFVVRGNLEAQQSVLTHELKKGRLRRPCTLPWGASQGPDMVFQMKRIKPCTDTIDYKFSCVSIGCRQPVPHLV